jgi:hypothetical protein
MKKLLLAFAVLCCFVVVALAAPKAGDPAPSFTATDSNG